MLNILKLFNYTVPNIDAKFDKKTNKFGPTGSNIPFEIKKFNDSNGLYYILYIKNQQWMMYNYTNHLQASHFFSNYYIATGDVITSGLGLAIRENWLLKKPELKSLTVLENNEDVIYYHKEMNPSLFKKANIIHCDVREYNGKCDTLLLDHYEFESMDFIINDVKKICNNIECEKLWFWHLETQLIADIHGVSEYNICDRFREGKFKIDNQLLKYIKIVYDKIKKDNNLHKLPELTIEELQLIIAIYTQFFQIM